MNKLFVKVKCRAYMKKISDGVHIQAYDSDGSFPVNGKRVFNDNEKLIAIGNGPNWEDNFEGIELADLSSCEGETVPKKYRKRVEEEFTGFVVGYTHIKCEGEIGTDTNYDPYSGEYSYCFKRTTWDPKVAVVYFKNNCKRYVLLDDLEEL